MYQRSLQLINTLLTNCKKALPKNRKFYVHAHKPDYNFPRMWMTLRGYRPIRDPLVKRKTDTFYIFLSFQKFRIS